MANIAKLTGSPSDTDRTNKINEMIDVIWDLQKKAGTYEEDHTPADPLETPAETFTISGSHYYFNQPTFKYKNTTYVSAEIIASPSSYTEMLTALIAAQTVDTVFQSGGLLTKSDVVIS